MGTSIFFKFKLLQKMTCRFSTTVLLSNSLLSHTSENQVLLFLKCVAANPLTNLMSTPKYGLKSLITYSRFSLALTLPPFQTTLNSPFLCMYCKYNNYFSKLNCCMLSIHFFNQNPS